MVSGFLSMKIKSATKSLTMNTTNTHTSIGKFSSVFEQTQVQRCYCLLNSLQMKYSSNEINYNSNEYKIIVTLKRSTFRDSSFIQGTGQLTQLYIHFFILKYRPIAITLPVFIQYKKFKGSYV